MIEQIEQQESEVKEGDVAVPNIRVRLFKTLDALLDFCKRTRTGNFNVREGVSPSGDVVIYELQYEVKENSL